MNIKKENVNIKHEEDYSCCKELFYINSDIRQNDSKKWFKCCICVYRFTCKCISFVRQYISKIVESKWFQQGILLAILINTLSMGIEFHDQPEGLTVIVETSNIVFSAIFAFEMVLKVIAEGPFKYISNGFNVFDGIIVILRYAN